MSSEHNITHNLLLIILFQTLNEKKNHKKFVVLICALSERAEISTCKKTWSSLCLFASFIIHIVVFVSAVTEFVVFFKHFFRYNVLSSRRDNSWWVSPFLCKFKWMLLHQFCMNAKNIEWFNRDAATKTTTTTTVIVKTSQRHDVKHSQFLCGIRACVVCNHGVGEIAILSCVRRAASRNQ